MDPSLPQQPVFPNAARSSPLVKSKAATSTISCFPAMVKNKASLVFGLLLLMLLNWVAIPAAAKSDSTQNIVLTLPAETILHSLQQILPLDIPSQSRQLQGDIIVESLDYLAIADNVITVRGVLSGRNLVVTTRLADQNIQLRVGEVHLPVLCALHTRFDPAHHALFVTPRFTDASANGKDDGLAPMLGALAGREYQVDLDALEAMNIQVGSRSIPIAMEPIKIAGINNSLVFHMLPRVGRSR